jgi:AcrR family transcriptional regulator
LTQAEKKAVTRDELIRAAADVFARRGYHGTSVEEVAEQAGFSHGAVYFNFAGKEGLFLAVFEDYMATRARELADTLAGAPEGLPERARAMAAQWMARFARDPSSFLLHLEFMVHARVRATRGRARADHALARDRPRCLAGWTTLHF